ncbi:MAG: PEP-CTERM sorting domain-containing protein [Verrucomicrobiae bacterium]|nr:PEP-CTERM sorting domain-containing protein [Verrucomicrobiae bacterium]
MKNRMDRMKWGAWAMALAVVTSLSPAYAQSYTTNVFASESLLYAAETNIYNLSNNNGIGGWAYDGNYFAPPYPYTVRTLLRFNMPSTNLPQVGQAILHFRAMSANAPSNPSFVPSYVSNDTWNSSTTWATQPSFTPLSGYDMQLTGPTSHLITNDWQTYVEYTANVTSFFTNNPSTEGQGQTMSVLMQGTESNGGRWYYFYARNGVDTVGAANANAFLEMTFIPEPSVMALVIITAIGGVLARRRRA